MPGEHDTGTRPAGIAGWSSGMKLGAWLGATAAICAAIQFVALLLGADFSILGSSLGRTVLVLVAIVNLLALMASDRRSPAEYGIVVAADWAATAGHGLLLGAGGFALYHVVGLLTGALEWNPAPLGGRLLLGTLEVLLTAAPIAVAQQLIFSGYLLGLLREAVGRTSALLGCSLLFAAAAVLGKPAEFLSSGDGLWLLSGLAALALLLGVIRLTTGSIVLSSGILAGGLIARRVLWKSRLLIAAEGHPLVEWFQRGGDTRSGPILCGVLLAAAGIVWLRLRRVGEPVVAGTPALSADFKKLIPFSNLLALAPLDVWLPRLIEAQFRIDPVYWLRLAWVLMLSAVNTLLSLPERLLAPWLLRHRVPAPVLIVGVHRSGTTHLHNLLALDPQFTVPRNFAVLNPFGALVAGWLITPLLGLFMNMRRPMDAVRVHLFSPQEEEFAIAGMTRLSPYWGFMLPRETARYDRCLHPEDLTPQEQTEWDRCVVHFLRKVTFWRRRPPLLKSPYNTARAGTFARLFPGARFIHICRHPYTTYLSNQHLAAEGLVAFQLQEPDPVDNYGTRFLDNYRTMEEAWYRDAARLPPGAAAEVRYEDLTRDPEGEIRRLYRELGLELSPQFEARLRRYLASVAGYTRNKHPQLPADVQARIDLVMGPYLDRWGYREPAAQSPSARAA